VWATGSAALRGVKPESGQEEIELRKLVAPRRRDTVDNELVLDRTRAELHFFGRRQAVIDPQSLCSHLDSLVGAVVGEVIMNNLETRIGREDGIWVRKTNPTATVRELVDILVDGDLQTGMGMTKVMLSDDPKAPIRIEVWNPAVKGDKGAAKSFLFSWWCGALSVILGRELEVKEAHHDEKANVMKCEITPRQAE